jgi:hypothetical protein
MGVFITHQLAIILTNDTVLLLQGLANDLKHPLPTLWLEDPAKKLGKVISELLSTAQIVANQYIFIGTSLSTLAN